jgi:hypothetical protein
MKRFKPWLNETMSVGAGVIRGMGYVTGSPDGESGGYVGDNIADADNRNNIIKALSTQHINMHKSTKASKGK